MADLSKENSNINDGNFDSGIQYGTTPEPTPAPAPETYQSAPSYPQGYVPLQPVKDETIGLGEWVGTILLTMIPCAGVILLFVWAFSADEKVSKKNYARAMLIIMGACIALYILLVIIIVASIVSVGNLYW